MRRMTVTLSICCLTLLATLSSSVSAADYQQPKELQQAWGQFLEGLQEAQDSLVKPEYVPPQPSDRVMAEGYRYLLGHLSRIIDYEMRADPMFPEFFRSVTMLRKWTGENPDTMYISAPIDAVGTYRVTGQAFDTREWRTSERSQIGAKAPRMVTFQTITNKPGDTGKLAEMANCRNQTLDFINGMNLTLDAENRFDILIGPARPKDYKGDFLLSSKVMTCPTTKKTVTEKATMLSVREIFSDWENEQPLELSIERLESVGARRPPITPDWMSKKLTNIGSKVPNQIQFWNLLLEHPMELHRDTNGDGKRPMPVNGINKPAPPFTAGGVAGAKQIYASGIFELQEEQALIIKITSPVEPHYIAFQLNNLWMEGPDQQNYVSSLTGHQNPVASDGARYYIIAHRDPGYQGWVDTTGLERGFHAMRFIFREDPSDDELPTSHSMLTTLSEIEKHLPKDLAKVSPEQRVQEIAVRQAHIKKRWREY